LFKKNYVFFSPESPLFFGKKKMTVFSFTAPEGLHISMLSMLIPQA